MTIREYLFGLQEGKNGRILPFTRFDTLLAALLAFALMVAMAYRVEPRATLTERRMVIVLFSIVLIAIVAQHRRIVFGTAFGVVTVRFLIAMLTGSHIMLYAAAGVLCAAIALFLLRDVH